MKNPLQQTAFLDTAITVRIPQMSIELKLLWRAVLI